MKHKNFNDKSLLQKMWENPIIKALIITVGGLAIIGLVGVSFEVLAYSTNKYKDLKTALKR
jgi:hypothetical protein